MTMNKSYLIPRIILAFLGLAMAAATIPAYGNPNFNPGLADLTGEALSLGNTAGAFLGRQLTVILIALIGAVMGRRLLIIIGGFGMAFMNGHDATFMGLMGGPATAAIGGLVFAVLGAAAAYMVWKKG